MNTIFSVWNFIRAYLLIFLAKYSQHTNCTPYPWGKIFGSFSWCSRQMQRHFHKMQNDDVHPDISNLSDCTLVSSWESVTNSIKRNNETLEDYSCVSICKFAHTSKGQLLATGGLADGIKHARARARTHTRTHTHTQSFPSLIPWSCRINLNGP
jgi:hypothetical protein